MIYQLVNKKTKVLPFIATKYLYHILKALIFIKIVQKLSHFSKKYKIF